MTGAGIPLRLRTWLSLHAARAFLCAAASALALVSSTLGQTPGPPPDAPKLDATTRVPTQRDTAELGGIASFSGDGSSGPIRPGEVTRPTLDRPRDRLEKARSLRRKRTPEAAQPILIELLGEGNAIQIQQAALIELAFVAQDQNDIPRAQQVYSQFLNRWPNDSRVPEILLRQGQLFRQMGLNTVSLAKFYAVMTSALALKSEQLDYYQRLVFQAQSEIAETHYSSGNYTEAADFFARLLKQGNSFISHSHVQYRLIRSLAALGRHAEVVATAEEFLARHPETPEQPEVRFYLALALKQIGRNGESLSQVLTLLKEQKAQMEDRPEVWAYWQQRAGNEVANQLYREGDYTKALEIYMNLAKLDGSTAWQVPVAYQIGVTFERLLQPEEAARTYKEILAREPAAGTNAAPGLKAVFDMARWRVHFIEWQAKADTSNRALAKPAPPAASTDSVVPDIAKQ